MRSVLQVLDHRSRPGRFDGTALPMNQPAHAIAVAAAILADHGDVAVARLGGDLQAWLDGKGPAELEQALGLERAGGRPWREGWLLERRDDVLRTMAGRFFAGQPQAAQADAIHTALERYAASAWLRERALDVCPSRHAGAVTASCWTLLRLRDSVPSVRHIRRILAMPPRW